MAKQIYKKLLFREKKYFLMYAAAGRIWNSFVQPHDFYPLHLGKSAFSYSSNNYIELCV